MQAHESVAGSASYGERDEVGARLDFAVRTGREAAALTLRYFQSPDLTVDRKLDRSPVTRADREAEELMRERLAASFSLDAIVGEEFGEQSGKSGFTWYLDPVDGTQSFIRGVPLFGTMLGLEHMNNATAGVIVFPALGEMVYAARGRGAWFSTGLNEPAGRGKQPDVRSAKVSSVAVLSDACFSTTSVSGFDEIGRRAAFERLLAAVRLGRGWTDCYGHYLVATGRVDVMIDPEMHVWDNAPLKPIIEEAGGRFTSLYGEATIHADSGVSTNGLLHEAVLSTLRG